MPTISMLVTAFLHMYFPISFLLPTIEISKSKKDVRLVVHDSSFNSISVITHLFHTFESLAKPTVFKY